MNTNLKETVTNAINNAGPSQNKTLRKVATYVLVGAIILFGCGLIWEVFSMPSEARALQGRIYEIQAELATLENKLTDVQMQWAELDVEQVLLEQQIEGIRQAKLEIEEGGGMIRHSMEQLRTEKDELTKQLAGFGKGLN